ncbi:MAG: thioredoxin family protein [Caldilineaceae bacterium]|nr:thioredoxin family protein [Caldilineaceae bacterium]
MSVAVDFQGAAKARPYVEQAKATFTTVVDADNVLGELFGFKAIPNGVFVDEAGVIRYTRFGGFDIRSAEYAELATRFAQSPDLDAIQQAAEAAGGIESDEALAEFQRGLAAYREGDVEKALVAWRDAVALEPDNWIIRKQIWAIEHPEKFYAGEVDFGWQREQIAQGL